MSNLWVDKQQALVTQQLNRAKKDMQARLCQMLRRHQQEARMELKVDKQLSKIETTWMALQLEYEPFKTTRVPILKDASATMKALDEHEVELQTMLGNRFMAFFETQSC